MSLAMESSTDLSLIGSLFTDPTNVERGKYFLDKYKPVILQVLSSKGLTGANAEDAFQDVMRKMLVGYKRFTRHGGGGFRSWLRCIAFSAAMNWYKRNPKLNDKTAQALGKTITLISTKEYQIELYEISLCRAKLEFHEKTWEMFVEAKMKGYPAKEVAKKMRVSHLTVYGAVRRISARLREIYQLLDDMNKPVPRPDRPES